MEPTPHEQAELFYWIREAMATDMSIFMTLLFGFLILVYFVGGKLDRVEATVITLLYSAFAIFLLLGFLSVVESLIVIGQQRGVLSEYAYLIYVGPVTMLLSWLLSIWYMVRVRSHSK